MRYWVDAAKEEARPAAVRLVTSRWFDATQTRFLAGRTFADDDRSAVVINETLADALGRRASVVGRPLRLAVDAGPPRTVTITGVVEDATAAAAPMAYLAMASQVPRVIVLTARARDAASGRNAVRTALRAADPAVPRDRVMTLDRQIRETSRGFEQTVALAAATAALAVMLAAAGLFALLSFMVRRRTREIGIRVALGASRSNVVSMVIRQALILAAIGCAVGFSIALGVGYVAQATVFGVSPLAPMSLLPTVALLLSVSVLASLPMAWRALRVEPAVTLRDD